MTIVFQFAVLLGIIFIVEIAVGIAAITFKNDLRDILNTQLRESMSRQNKVSCCVTLTFIALNLFALKIEGWRDGLGHTAEEVDVLRSRWTEKLVRNQQQYGIGRPSELLQAAIHR